MENSCWRNLMDTYMTHSVLGLIMDGGCFYLLFLLVRRSCAHVRCSSDNLMEALGCEDYPGKSWRERGAAAELDGDGLTGKGEEKEKLHRGRCAQSRCEAWTWRPWHFIMVLDSRWEFSTCLWGWRVRKSQAQGFPQPLPVAGDGVCGPLQSLRQVMDDCGSFKDVSVGGVTGVESHSHKHDQNDLNSMLLLFKSGRHCV